MTTIAQQTQQPVPLFYGVLGDGTTTVELEPGFDYVITAIVLTGGSGAGAQPLEISDESGVTIFQLGIPASSTPNFTPASWFGEMPIGPRTALLLDLVGAGAYAYIGGYALNPVTALHV